jgi:hypothetical protein
MNVVNIVKNKFNNEFNNLLKYWDTSGLGEYNHVFDKNLSIYNIQKVLIYIVNCSRINFIH